MGWQKALLHDLELAIQKNKVLRNTFKLERLQRTNNIHLAVFTEPFLSLIMEGRKKIESRFSVNKVAPFDKIIKGDLIVLKKTGGPVVGICFAEKIFSFSNVDKKSLSSIKERFANGIASEIDPEFWKNRAHSKFISLIELDKVRYIEKVLCHKKDRRGWVVLTRN